MAPTTMVLPDVATDCPKLSPATVSVPDSTWLGCTNAGWVPFKPHALGRKKPKGNHGARKNQRRSL